MARPVSIEKWNNELIVRMDDGTRARAIKSTGELWLVGQPPPPPPVPQPPSGARFIWPFPLNLVTSEYGPRNGRLHAGIDFGNGAANIAGTAIPAASAGKVIVANKTNSHGGYGNAVVLDHGDGLHTLYGHMRFLPNGQADVSVNVGDIVQQGQRLGGVGKTGRSFGVHLHFETHEGGYRWDASSRNPRQFFERWNK